MTKYQYFKVIKQKYSSEYGFEEVSIYETKSNFSFKTKEERECFTSDLKEYKTLGYPISVTRRRILRK